MHVRVEREHWSAGNVLLDICDLPNAHFAIFSRAGEEKITVISDCNSVDRVSVLVERRYECALKFVLCVRRRFPFTSKLVGNFHSLDLVGLCIFKTRQH